jgi:hypothetical protein
MSSKPRATAVDGRPRFQTPDLSGDDLLAGGADAAHYSKSLRGRPLVVLSHAEDRPAFAAVQLA